MIDQHPSQAGLQDAPAAVPYALLDDIRGVVGARHLRIGAAADVDPGTNPENLGAGIIVAPATTEEVAAVVRLCDRHGVPVVAQGGRTGLVGGSVSEPGEIVLSLERMNRIERLDAVERTAVVQAGVVLEALRQAAAEHRLEPGIDLAARGSATVGGMVSTNAGGVMAFRNGVMRHRVLGLEAVLADGSVYRDMTRVVKNAAGYDLKHLFIGAEGTLGIVTRAVLKLDPTPRATATALFGLPSVTAALDLIRLALDSETGQLRAAEALWRSFIDLTASAHGWSEPDFELDQPFYLLLALGGGREEALRAEFEKLFGDILERHPETTGIVAGSKRQEEALWRLREDTDIIYRAHAAAPSYDVSVPLSQIDGYVDRILTGLGTIDPELKPFVFGHLADGNLHIVLNRRGPLPTALAAALYADLAALGGSFSAEHGVGSKRIHALAATADRTKLKLMRRVKDTLDSHALMNPGKVLPLVPPPDNDSNRNGVEAHA
ncbi:FAD-binding oxidoreductase [Mesorhizobium silamurunense]|uniref:FAD-binding oxidoreductase n=1 Tax=Mesorhizobium silamurunense TaxID=499528 RepID=UPI00178672F5|nr:FAD-binding oxidoreductase [Mesorhizobium silamurunense]